ncbi:hypothetical protein Ancab_012642 [Ancistrocladus abbreviatus]
MLMLLLPRLLMLLLTAIVGVDVDARARVDATTVAKPSREEIHGHKSSMAIDISHLTRIMTAIVVYHEQNGKTTTKIELKHKAGTMQNNEHSLLVFSSKVEDGIWLTECVYGELTSIDHALDLDLKPPEAKPDDPVSSSMPTELNESGELAKLGHGPHPVSQSLDLQPKQNEPQVNNQQGLLSPIAMEGQITTGPQHLHAPLQPPSFPVDSFSLLCIDRESPEENGGQRKAMDSTRKKKTKSMAEISRSKGATGKNGRRSMRVQRTLLDAGMPRSPLFTETEDSGVLTWGKCWCCCYHFLSFGASEFGWISLLEPGLGADLVMLVVKSAWGDVSVTFRSILHLPRSGSWCC